MKNTFLQKLGVSVGVATSLFAGAFVLADGIATDKSVYELIEYGEVTGGVPESAIQIYRLDDPESLEPANMYAAMLNELGAVSVDMNTLVPGHFVFVNTSESGNCGGLSLADCRADANYHGEVEIEVLAPIEE